MSAPEGATAGQAAYVPLSLRAELTQVARELRREADGIEADQQLNKLARTAAADARRTAAARIEMHLAEDRARPAPTVRSGIDRALRELRRMGDGCAPSRARRVRAALAESERLIREAYDGPVPAAAAHEGLQDAPEYAKWRAWLTEENYDFDDDSYQASAFLAGMNAARDLAAAVHPALPGAAPWQAAYEAWHAKLAEHHPVVLALRQPKPWDELSAEVQAEWEAAAQAAINAHELAAPCEPKAAKPVPGAAQAAHRAALEYGGHGERADELWEQWAKVGDDTERYYTAIAQGVIAHALPGLAALVRDMLQAFPDTADEQEWRDRAGALGICDPDGKPYRAYTEDDL